MKIQIKKGLDLPIAGGVASSDVRSVPAATVAVVPDDFPGFQPKVEVAQGDTVRLGDALMHDKRFPGVKLVSPVAGKVVAVERGERRRLLKVVVEAAGDDFKKFDLTRATPQECIDLLAESGMLALIRRRPYDVVPSPEVRPRDIFVTAIYSAPLEIETGRRIVADDKSLLELAAGFLARITTGKVYISHRASWTLGPVKGAVMVRVDGPHPAGNAGVQAANIAPVNKGETVWTLDVETLRRIGHLLRHGKVDSHATVAVCGPAVENPYVAKTVVGAPVEALMKGIKTIDSKHHRIVSGNVLVGTVVPADGGYLRYPYRMLTVLDEGDDVDEFMGWASMSPAKMSVSRTFPGHFLKKLFRPDARLLGGRRAMIMSGEYDAMMPMDVMPEYLLKAIIARDIENMERLGIYEVAPEDFALAEYADTSKIPLQHIVREGLDYLRNELE
ncbi:MAG: NADH:ubiquinone reductase (Na(+)-transporting) subunit A [Muribaculaceae bacterium]|nr:NADH:ubiquinone reductase (Na(+)-transporting) subunit A [Muribaculaceae bacterium]